jgi:hypothetical protein
MFQYIVLKVVLLYHWEQKYPVYRSKVTSLSINDYKVLSELERNFRFWKDSDDATEVFTIVYQ